MLQTFSANNFNMLIIMSLVTNPCFDINMRQLQWMSQTLQLSNDNSDIIIIAYLQQFKDFLITALYFLKSSKFSIL